MVRLVFRPYTQLWGSICTSEPLRASTRVSPGFALITHSSPSFGSQHKNSYSDLWPKPVTGRCCTHHKFTPQQGLTYLHFHFAHGFATLTLASMLDSLVRVSRRAVGNHFVSITLTLSHLQESLIITQNIACNKSHHYKWQANLIGCQATSIDSTTGNQCYNNGRSQIPSLKPSLAKPIHADLPRNTGTPKQH